MSASVADPGCESCSPLPQRRICGYLVVRELGVGGSYLAMAAGARRVVLKRLEGDCLLRGQLHPNVRQRLERVRELAHMGVANLIGVEREGDGAYLVWEYVEGRTWEEVVAHDGPSMNNWSAEAAPTIPGSCPSCHAERSEASSAASGSPVSSRGPGTVILSAAKDLASPATDTRSPTRPDASEYLSMTRLARYSRTGNGTSLRSQILRCAQDDSRALVVSPQDHGIAATRLARELVLLVEGMHVLGIVHGAIHGRNVILDTNGRLRLTHVSPLLYYDPAEDVAAVMALLRETDRVASGRGEARSALAWALDEAEREKASLRRVAELLGQTPRQSMDVAADAGTDKEALRLRRGALWGALAVAGMAAGLAYGLWCYANVASGSRMTPVEAPPAAMQAR